MGKLQVTIDIPEGHCCAIWDNHLCSYLYRCKSLILTYVSIGAKCWVYGEEIFNEWEGCYKESRKCHKCKSTKTE